MGRGATVVRRPGPPAAGVGLPGVVRLRDGDEATYYLIREYPDPGDGRGRAFTATRLGSATTYEVRADRGGGECECKGFLARGWCRHAAGLCVLIGSGGL